MAPEAQAAPLLREGQLVNLAPDSRIFIALFSQQWKLGFPALTAASEAVAVAAAEALDTGQGG